MAGLAQGSLDSLLGRLTSVLLDEAQLLGGVRCDVEFIRDEMESMNGVLLHLTEAQHRDHQVRAWMKQVAGLAWDCGGYVELYVRHVGAPADPRATKGLLGCLRRLIRLLRTVPARHRVATRIRELKVRARDVGDRRKRYGVTVPSHQAAAADDDDDDATIDVVHSPWAFAAAGAEEEADVRRRALLAAHGELPPDDEETIVNKGIDRLVEWLLPPEEAPAAAAAGGGRPQLRVFPILYKYYSRGSWWTQSKTVAARIARGVYEHPSVVSSFGCKARLEPLKDLEPELLQLRTAGKRFLILLEYDCLGMPVLEKNLWEAIKSALLHAADDGYPAGSAIILTSSSDDFAKSSSYKTFHLLSLYDFFYCQATALIAWSSEYCDMNEVILVQDQCYPDAFSMKMLLHLLYVNPKRKKGELRNLSDRLSECKRLNKSVAKQMLMLCYNELHSKYRSCLLYLSVFPEDHIIRRTSLARRWIAEGLIATKTDHIESAMDRSKHGATATDEAERYFDVLLTRGFLCPGEISAEGNVKSCTVHHQVRKFITRIATDVNFVGNLPLDLAHHLSIHNKIGLHASHSDLPLDANGSGIVAFLPSLAKSSQWQLLKVLDLEGCKGLKKHHLKSICKMLLLKYLSLRNTDVVELPKQIQKLQCLETLDIRQTKIQALATKAIVLPMLKYFLAGRKVSAGNEAATRSEDSFSTVHMPLCIQKMKNMEILSHVQVSNSDNELASIAQLLKLRKLGVVLDGKNAKLNDLFRQIEKLHRCLRSLSIRIDQPARSESTPES